MARLKEFYWMSVPVRMQIAIRTNTLNAATNITIIIDGVQNLAAFRLPLTVVWFGIQYKMTATALNL